MFCVTFRLISFLCLFFCLFLVRFIAAVLGIVKIVRCLNDLRLLLMFELAIVRTRKMDFFFGVLFSTFKNLFFYEVVVKCLDLFANIS